MPLHPDYKCQCQVPHLQRHLGEDTGLCEGCTLVYDESLYEKRLRQHVSGWDYDSIHDFLMDVDPAYQALNSQG